MSSETRVSSRSLVDALPLQRLPLVTLYLTDRCNSRCVTCDYWRHGRTDVTLQSVQRLLPDLRRLHTQTVLLSGGEPLLHPQWQAISELLRANGQRVWLLTAGLALAKHAGRAVGSFEHITVSLDGTDAPSYAAIRGLDAFDKVCEGILAVAGRGRAAGLRVTLQRANFRQLPDFIRLAKELRARSVSFLTVDVDNAHAFARTGDIADQALPAADLADFDRLIEATISGHAADFASGFIEESPAKLRRHLQYFKAVRGLSAHPPVRCNAPEFSAVIDTTGAVHPCFFIPGPADARLPHGSAGALESVLNSRSMAGLRSDIRSAGRAECKTCVCSLWRDPAQMAPAARPASSLAPV
jgi:Fe-coproporphyrin III synthase